MDLFFLFLIPFTVQQSPFFWFLLSYMTLNRVQADCPVEAQHPGYARVFPLYSHFWGDTIEFLVILWEEQFAPTQRIPSSQFLCVLHV